MMSLSLNLTQRLSLIQELGLKSDHLESCLVRCEQFLQASSRNQRGCKFLTHMIEGQGFRGVLDALVYNVVPQARTGMRAYYRWGGQRRMIEQFDWAEIDQMDRDCLEALEMLNRLHDQLKELEIPTKEIPAEYQQMALNAIAATAA